MSVIVGIKCKDGVLLGADKQATGSHLKIDNATKVKAYPLSNTAVGVVGALRDCNVMCTQTGVINTEDILFKTPMDFDYVVKKVVPNIFNILKDNFRLSTTPDGIRHMLSPMVFATSNGLFYIGPNGEVVEYNTYCALGCGEDLVNGFLATKKLDPNLLTWKEAKSLITKSIVQACRDDVYINDNIDFVFLKKDTVE